jgi:hypothetical protein
MSDENINKAEENKVIQISFVLSPSYRKLLGLYVLRRQKENPEVRHSASGVAKEVLCDFLRDMEKHNDREDIPVIPNPTNCNQTEVKHTPVENINRLWEELTLDDIGKSLRELNISPPMFFKVILEKLLKDDVKRHQLKKWFEREIINRTGKETQNEHTDREE